MATKKRIALVAHDKKKRELLNWMQKYLSILSKHSLYATGSTGKIIENKFSFAIHKLESGPLGGDQQLGARIVDGKIDLLVFFWDPLEAQPHDPDVRALLRIAVVWNIPIACNPATADIIIESHFMQTEYRHVVPDYSEYRDRKLK